MLLVLVLADAASASDRARLRWAPGEGGSVLGYRVHVRRAETPQYSDPLEVGVASEGPAGSREYVVAGLDPTAAYVVSVTAYGESGASSDRSNEMLLPPRAGPCAVGVGGAGSADSTATLSARLRVRRGRLTGVGTSVFSGTLEPQITGVSATLAGATGAMLHRLEVPAVAFRSRGRRGGARWVGRDSAGSRLVIRARRGTLRIRVRSPIGVRPSAGDQPLTWVVHVGSACVRQADILCRERGPRVRCD